jgi:hypothetical protein
MADPHLLDMPPQFTPRMLVEGAERELRYRERVYPRLVAKGSMSKAKMEYELALQWAIIERLAGIAAYAERRGA